MPDYGVTAAWYITTETISEIKKGGYVQGTALSDAPRNGRARLGRLPGRAEPRMLRHEVARQIETMVGLNQAFEGHGRIEQPVSEDADLQMAGDSLRLRVLTDYTPRSTVST